MRERGGSATGTVSLRIGPGLAMLLDRSEGLISPRGRHIVATAGLLFTFLVIDTRKVVDFLAQGFMHIDLRLYRAAAHAVLAGQNPWPAETGAAGFAATPPAVLTYMPAALLPEAVAIAIYTMAAVVAAGFVIRTLRLPLWWMLFPPLFESVLVLNPDVFVIALLLAGSRVAALAVPMKTYAAIPLLLDGRRWAFAVGILLSLLAAPLWFEFFGQLGSIAQRLSTQSFGGLSAWGTWLMIPTALSLFLLRRHGASWLAVPGLWPYTQLHYSCLALPVAAANPVLAFLFSFSIPFFPPIAIVGYAIGVGLARLASPYRRPAEIPAPSARPATNRGRQPMPRPAAATADGRTVLGPSA